MSNVADVKSGAPELTMVREFSHPPEAVFRAWTETNALRQWMGPGEITAPKSQIDARVGGALTIPMTHPDGTVLTARGEILEMVDGRRLRFSWAWDQEDGSPGQRMEIALDFEPTPGGTRLVLHQTNFIDAEARDKHEFGWNGCCDKLRQYLAA